MKRIVTAIICLFGFCFAIQAQTTNIEEMSEKQLKDSIKRWNGELKRLPNYINVQDRIINKNIQKIQEIKAGMEEERSQYPEALLMAYDKQKVMEMEEYLKQPFSEISIPKVKFFMEKAERYPQDKDMSRMAKLMASTMETKSIYEEANNLKNRLSALRFKVKEASKIPFTYNEIQDMTSRLIMNYNITKDKRLEDVDIKLEYNMYGLEYFKKLVDDVQKVRSKKQDVLWEKDYQPLFDNLDKKENSNSSAKKIEFITSLPYLQQCLEQLQSDLQTRPMEASPVEDLILHIMGK